MENTAKKEMPPAEVNFSAFLSSLMAEALIFMGEIENPITKKKELNLDHSKYIIDLISLLKDKTKGNLTAEEANGIDGVLYDLRMRYLAKGGKRADS